MDYKISVDADGRSFSCALHFAAHNCYRMTAVSFVGRPTAAKAIASALGMGMTVDIVTPTGKQFVNMYGGTKTITRSVDDVVHVLAFSNLLFNEESTQPYVFAPDGNIPQAIGEFLCSKFSLPQDWLMEYARFIDFEYIGIVRNPEADKLASAEIIQIKGVKNPDSCDLEIFNEESMITALSNALKDGSLKIPRGSVDGQFDSSWTLQEYLKTNARVFSEQVQGIKPVYNPLKDKIHPAVVMERIPFPSQAYVIQGLVNELQRDRVAFAVGDMGTGKSIISLGVVNVLHSISGRKASRFLLTAPGITIPKWQNKEIGETLPNAKVFTIRSTEDAAYYLRRAREGRLSADGINFVLVGIDRAKLGPDPWCAALWKRIAGTKTYSWHCPECGRWISDPVFLKNKESVPVTWSFFANEPFSPEKFSPSGMAKTKIKWSMPPKLRKCPHADCQSPLWRPALKSRGETANKPRWFVSDILKRLKKHFDLFIADEVHQTKGENSGRGSAFAQMVKAGKKTLCLTGTLVNGLSTSIKEILWRTDPTSLIKDGFDHKSGMIQWASRYGVLERVICTSGDDEGIHTKRKRVERQPKEKPGIAPALVATHLLHRSAFLELPDLGLPIVEFNEIPVFVELDKVHQEMYTSFHSNLYNHCKQAYAKGNNGAFSKFIPSTINAVDRSDLENVVEVSGESSVFTGLGANYINAKERKLVELVSENLAEGRGCVVYCFYTDTYAVHRRIQKVLRDNGIDAEILGSHVSPEKRFEWLYRAEERGIKVFICNLRLVEVGLDLYPWPTIIYYQMSYDINSVRQSSRRAWRIGQVRSCRTYYLIANKTQQVAQFESCMNKRAHALLAEGRLDRSELKRFGRDASNSLAADLAECLAGSDLASKWTYLAKKDQGLETIEEERFQKVLKEVQTKLANETLRLVGLSETIEAKEEEALVVEAATPPKRRSKKVTISSGQLRFNFQELVG